MFLTFCSLNTLLGISHLTGKRYKTPKVSAISDHLLLTVHNADLDDFSIINRDTNRSNFTLLLRESLLIYRDQPSLNKTTQSYPLALFNEQNVRKIHYMFIIEWNVHNLSYK